MRNISSVTVGTKKPSIGIADLFLILGIILLLAQYFIIGVLLFMLGVYISINSKPKYVLLLNTSDGEVRDLVTKNLNQVELIAEAINTSKFQVSSAHK